MIDTEQFEGHTPAPWNVYGPHPLYRHGTFDNEFVAQPLPFTQIDTLLIASAPLLLAEVKRLREGVKKVVEQLTHPISYGYNDVNNEEHVDNLKELIE